MPDRLKILQVIDTFAPGGAERVALNLANLLCEAGATVTVLTLLDPGPLAAMLHPSIQVTSLNRRHRFDLNAVNQYRKLAQNADLVHVHMRHNYRYCRLIGQLMGVQTPLVLHDHYGRISEDQTVPFLLGSFLKPKWYIGVSSTLCTWAKECLHIAPERMRLLPNIVRRSELNSACSGCGIVLASNLKSNKNQAFALQILAKTKENLTFYGAVQSETYFQTLQKMVVDMGLSERVRFVHDCTDIQAELSKFRLGLHCSPAETGPLVLIEYLAQGLPFLAYDTGEVAELLRAEFPEFFIDNFDPDGWLRRIEILLQKAPAPEKMRAAFELHFGDRPYTEKCLEFYRRIIGTC
jgi:glycosyltransferase involved in cell wall biosynthesis